MTFRTLITASVFVAPFFIVATPLRANEEAREFPAFDAVTFGGAGDLFITVGGEQSVVLQGDPRLLEEVETEVRNGRLYIKREDTSWFSFGRDDYGPLTVLVSVPELEGVLLAGSGNLDVEGLEGGETKLTIAGSGRIDAEGTLEALHLTIHGSGDINTEKLITADAQVTINGSGDVRVHVREELNATINGSGEIAYLGEPENVKSTVRGSGKIRRK